ncbi:reverse transcriptase domain-containing protein [Tanacetum coccineum]
MFKQLHINISFADALILIPKYQKMLKSLLSNKEKLIELENTPLNENCSVVILKKLPKKLGDPGKFLIPCGFSELKCKALFDLSASIKLMPLSVLKEMFFVGSVGKFTFLADFVIVDYESDPRVPLVLGRPFLRTARALIDVHGEEMILRDEREIKDSKILIDELDLPGSSDFLPFPECDSVFYEDFSEDDAFTNCATPEKNVKKATNASLILEDSYPPLSLYELPFHKEVPGLGILLSFSSKNEEKVFNPGILTSKRVHTSLLPKLSHRGPKAFKVIKISLKGYNKGIAESTRCEDQSLLGIWEIYSRDGGIMEAPVLKIECTSTSNLFHRSLQLPDIKVLKRNRQNQLLLNLSQFSEEDRQFTVAGAREHSRSPGSAKDWGYSALTARGFGHYARNGRKPKADLEAHFSYWKIPEVLTCGIKFKLISQLEQVDHNATESVMRNAKKLPDESSRALGEATSSRDSSLIALQTKQTELEKYTALNDLTNHDACVSRYLKDVNARTKNLRNDQFAPILGYGDLIQGNVYDQMGFYYVRRTLHHNLFSVRSICDADLEESTLYRLVEMSKAKKNVNSRQKAVPSSKRKRHGILEQDTQCLFKEEGIELKLHSSNMNQNGVVERRNRLVLTGQKASDYTLLPRAPRQNDVLTAEKTEFVHIKG